VSLYRIILNALPIFFPANIPLGENLRDLFTSPVSNQDEQDDPALDDSPSSPSPSPPSQSLPLHISLGDRREARLSPSAQVHQSWVRKKTRRWHSVLAGAVAGAVAISFEKRSRRRIFGQQLFVRCVSFASLSNSLNNFGVSGLQGSYNSYSEKSGFCIPHGEVVAFALACGQIVYAHLLSPHTLPKSYNRWFGHMIHVPPEAISMHRSMTRRGTYDSADLSRILARPDLHPNNVTHLAQWRATLPPYAVCAMTHPHVPRCISVPQGRFLTVARWIFPVYGALHFVPLFFFKRAALVRAPGRMALRAAWGTMRSTAFLSLAVVMYQAWFCGMQNAHRAVAALRAREPAVPAWLLEAVVSRPAHWIGGVIMGLSLFVETKHRRGELAMYALPKALDSAWVSLRGRGLVLHTGKYGSPLLTAIAMGMVMSTYQNDPQHLSGLVRRVLYQFIGPN